MEEKFDPYYKWLAIPPRDQPPNHYRLLAVDLFEPDVDVIDAAADQRMAYLQQVAAGEHVEASQRLLNELSAARRCLVVPKDKATYDTELRLEMNLPTVRSVESSAGGVSAPTGVKALPTGTAVSSSSPPPPPPPSTASPSTTFTVSDAPVEAASAMNRYRSRQHGPKPTHLVAMGLIVFLVVSCFIGVYFALQAQTAADANSSTPSKPAVETPDGPRPINPPPVLPDEVKPEIPTPTPPDFGPDDPSEFTPRPPFGHVDPDDPGTTPPNEFGPNGDPLNDPNLRPIDPDDPGDPRNLGPNPNPLLPAEDLRPVVPLSPEEIKKRQDEAMQKLKNAKEFIKADDLPLAISALCECINYLPKSHQIHASLLLEQTRNVNNAQWIRRVIENLPDRQLDDLIDGKLLLDIDNPPFCNESLRKLFQEKAAVIASKILDARREEAAENDNENDFIPLED